MLRDRPADRLLDHPVRQTIMDEVRLRPGPSFLELRDRVAAASGRSSAGHGTLSHHVYHLERAGLLLSRRAGRHRRFFLPQHAAHATRMAAMRDPTIARLLDLVDVNPGLCQTPIVETVAWRSRASLSRLLIRLHDAGLVRRAREGHFVRYWPTSAGLPQGPLPQSLNPGTTEPMSSTRSNVNLSQTQVNA